AASLLSDVEGYKVEAACELAQELISAGGAPLILTLRVSTAHEIADRLDAVCATGEIEKEKRAAILQGATCGVSTIYAVTEGIPLTNFDCVIMCGLDWVPAKLLQAEARPHRIGQNRNVRVFYLIGKGTIDEIVRERV